jgi:Cu/Ag efflux pump CusA
VADQIADHGWIAHRYESFLRRRAGTAAGSSRDADRRGRRRLLYFRLETGFLPEMDEGGYVIDYITPTGTSLQETDQMLRRLEAVLQSTPEVAGFTRRTGTEMGMFATEQNSGDILVHLKPRSARDRDVEEIISEQRARFAQELPAVEIEFVQLLQDMLGDLQGTAQPVEVKIFGDDIKTLGEIAERLEGKLEKINGLVDLVGPRTGNPELEVRIGATRAAKAGFTAQEVATQLSNGPPGRRGHRGTAGGSAHRSARSISGRLPLQPELDREYPLMTQAGAAVPLSAVANVEPVQGAAQLYREDLKQMVPITGRLEGRDMGSVIQDVKQVLASEPLPLGYTYQIGGQYETQQESFRSLLVVWSSRSCLVFVSWSRSSAASPQPSSSCRQRPCRWPARSAFCC